MSTDFLLDHHFKVYPTAAAPCQASELGHKGWNVLAGDLPYPDMTRRRGDGRARVDIGLVAARLDAGLAGAMEPWPAAVRRSGIECQRGQRGGVRDAADKWREPSDIGGRVQRAKSRDIQHRA